MTAGITAGADVIQAGFGNGIRADERILPIATVVVAHNQLLGAVQQFNHRVETAIAAGHGNGNDVILAGMKNIEVFLIGAINPVLDAGAIADADGVGGRGFKGIAKRFQTKLIMTDACALAALIAGCNDMIFAACRNAIAGD